ncbi:MAG: hypothetical protein NTV24_03385 [Candidatus Woesebacteria bacterium]|nr:hypothetical protein [Candidatus Woesebacteria bacterium]
MSTYILLFPFVGKEKMKTIFPENMFTKDSLYEILESLVLENKVKPFEGVGTRQEIKHALAKSNFQFGKNLPLLLKKIKLVLGNVDKIISEHKSILESWGENNLDDNYEKYLRQV